MMMMMMINVSISIAANFVSGYVHAICRCFAQCGILPVYGKKGCYAGKIEISVFVNFYKMSLNNIIKNLFEDFTV
jgi:hypothetical protein